MAKIYKQPRTNNSGVQVRSGIMFYRNWMGIGTKVRYFDPVMEMTFEYDHDELLNHVVKVSPRAAITNTYSWKARGYYHYVGRLANGGKTPDWLKEHMIANYRVRNNPRHVFPTRRKSA